MKKFIFVLAALPAAAASARAYVPGYQRQDGSYVSGHTRSSPDAVQSNNYGDESRGGRQLDEFSSGTGATNKTNLSYGWRDNDRDGVSNAYVRRPDSRRGW